MAPEDRGDEGMCKWGDGGGGALSPGSTSTQLPALEHLEHLQVLGRGGGWGEERASSASCGEGLGASPPPPPGRKVTS